MECRYKLTSFKISRLPLPLVIGTVGLLLAIAGNFFPDTLLQKWLYFFAGNVLLVSALMERAVYFIILEVIVVASTVIAFVPGHLILKAAVPLVMSAVAIPYLLSKEQYRNLASILGILGLVSLALGYALIHPLIYFLGGFFLAIYSFIAYFQGERIAILFAVLNTIFAATALLSMF